MNATDVMLDLETMGTSTDSAIIAVGAVGFNTKALEFSGDVFYLQVNLKSSVDAGLVIDPATVLWWLKQSDEARGAFRENDQALGLKEVLSRFQEWWVKSIGEARLWGNGAAFDNVLLAGAFKRCGLVMPWSYKDDRCYRTLRALYPHVQPPDNTAGYTPHNAMSDAVYQSKHLLSILREMRIPAGH